MSSLQTSGGGGDVALQSVSSEEGSTSTARGAVGGKQVMECPLCLAQVSIPFRRRRKYVCIYILINRSRKYLE